MLNFTKNVVILLSNFLINILIILLLFLRRHVDGTSMPRYTPRLPKPRSWSPKPTKTGTAPWITPCITMPPHRPWHCWLLMERMLIRCCNSSVTLMICPERCTPVRWWSFSPHCLSSSSLQEHPSLHSRLWCALRLHSLRRSSRPSRPCLHSCQSPQQAGPLWRKGSAQAPLGKLRPTCMSCNSGGLNS